MKRALLLGFALLVGLGGCSVRASVPGAWFAADSYYHRPYRGRYGNDRDYRWHRPYRRPYDDRYRY